MPAAVRLRSDAIELEALPRCGGRITALRDRRSGRDALWSSRTRAHREHPAGTSFDDVFAGGWDELVPNDEPTHRLPDHGELWTARLDVVDRGEQSLELAGVLPISELALEKRIAITGDQVVVDLRIVNAGAQPVGVAVKLHPALSIATGARVLAPPGPAHVPDVALSRAAADFEWPEAIGHDGEPVRADLVPAPGPIVDWLRLRGDGRCGLVHESDDWAATEGVQRLTPGQALECAVRCRLGPAALADEILGDGR